ncbi:MAG: response regulator, partial [Chloroflexaceae bacterium]|nr:response regulator [Chloroflexaceae bacterium]
MARILVVEDEPMVRDLVMTYLRMVGFEVIAAGDGIQALRLAHGDQPDLVLMDMGLPKLNGWQTT